MASPPELQMVPEVGVEPTRDYSQGILSSPQNEGHDRDSRFNSSSGLSEIRRFAVGSPRNGALSLTTFEMQFAGSQHTIDPQVAPNNGPSLGVWRLFLARLPGKGCEKAVDVGVDPAWTRASRPMWPIGRRCWCERGDSNPHLPRQTRS